MTALRAVVVVAALVLLPLLSLSATDAAAQQHQRGLHGPHGRQQQKGMQDSTLTRPSSVLDDDDDDDTEVEDEDTGYAEPYASGDPFRARPAFSDDEPTWWGLAQAAWDDDTPPALILETLSIDPVRLDYAASQRTLTLSILFSVAPEVAAAHVDIVVDDVFQPVELHFAGPLGQPLVVSCDEAAVRPRMRPPRIACRTVADLPAANANGHWELQMVAERSAPAIGGAIVYTRDDLTDLGLPTGFDVVNSPTDNAAPELVGAVFVEGVDADGWPATNLCVRFRDEPSGLSLGRIKGQAVSQLRVRRARPGTLVRVRLLTPPAEGRGWARWAAAPQMRSTLERIWQPAWSFLIPRPAERFEGVLCRRIEFPFASVPVVWEVRLARFGAAAAPASVPLATRAPLTRPADRRAVGGDGNGQVAYLYLVDDVGNGIYYTGADLAARGVATQVRRLPPFNGTLASIHMGATGLAPDDDDAADDAGHGHDADAADAGGPGPGVGAVYI